MTAPARPFDGKVALVTGAAGGLGSAVAHHFASLGADVACVDVAAPDSGERQDGEGRRVSFAADVADETAVARLRSEIHDALGHVDLVFNIAGILRRTGLHDTAPATFRQVLDVNLVGTYLVTRAFATDMTDRSWGRVVNVGSVAAVTGYPALAYAASKAAIVSLTRSMLHDFWDTGVTVNAVCPGAMDTPMMDPTIRETVVRKTPAARVVPPEEVAHTFEFLAADTSASVNGQVLVIDGGATTVFQYPDR